jgi:hypothetical protein
MSYDEPFGDEAGEGWKNIVQATHNKLKYIDPNYKIAQIKEKFGGLRYYFDSSIEYGSIAHDIMHDVVRFAEYEATKVCQVCGTGKYDAGVELRVHHYWYYNYCKECSDKHIATYYKDND